MTQPPSLFAPLNRPYYIFAPHYQQGSGGVRAMHYLCHALNLLGEEAYVTNPNIHLGLRTPVLTTAIGQMHDAAGREPIVVYAEVVTANPLQARNVVRYLLAVPGLHTGQQIQLQPRDLLYTFGPTLVPPGWSADPLRMPLVDTKIFNSDGVRDDQRKGSAVFIHRHLDKGGQLDPVTADSIEISYRVPERSADELAEIFRRVECLYLYEYSTICFEALLCGCPVVFIMNDVSLPETTPWLMGGHGIAWGLAPEALVHAKATVHEVKAFYAEEQRVFWRDLDAFVAKTQAQAAALDTPMPAPGQPGSASVISHRAVNWPSSQPAKKAPAAAPRKRRLVVCGIETPKNACPIIRLIAPFSFYPDDWEVVWGIANSELNFATVRSADVILLHRFMPGVCSPDVLKAIFDLGKPVIYETDDLLTEVPDGIPNAEFMRRGKAGMEYAIRHANAVVVSTQFIADKYKALNPNIHVLVNFLDFDRFYRPVPMQPRAKISIGLVGTSLMPYNFALVDAALRSLCERYAGQIRLCFIGHQVPAGWEGHPAVEYHPVLHEYHAYAEWLLEQQLDIALIPLVDDAFNNSKSVIKWMEYSAAGVASVFSDVATYRTVVDSGRNGMLVEETPAAWQAAIETLVADPALRRRLARTAQAEVRKHFALRENAWRYHQTYLRAIGETEQAAGVHPADRTQSVPGVLVLDAEGSAEKIQRSLDGLSRGPYAGVPVIVLTTLPGQMPEWTDSLRCVQTTADEYVEAAEQLCALADFDWAVIIEAGQ